MGLNNQGSNPIPYTRSRGWRLNSRLVGEWKCLMRGLFEHASFSTNDEVRN